MILPRTGEMETEPVFAGAHVLNGNGEMTGLPWVEESGLLTTPVAITNTHSVGVARDALIAYAVGRGSLTAWDWGLPVVAETWDGFLNDINGMHVRPEHVFAALDGARSGPVAEGCVGGGTGMICHEFKGGIGTASRLLNQQQGGWTLGVLVQANYGDRALLRIDGVPVGQAIGPDEVPLPGAARPGAGSIIGIVATDAPLLPGQCRRLAQRVGLGVARMGGVASDSSGDIFLAFSTANRPAQADSDVAMVRMLANAAMTPLFEAVMEATEEAIANALCVATTLTGIDGHTAHALPHERLREVLRHYRRLAE